MKGTVTGTKVAPQFFNLYAHYEFQNILSDATLLSQDRFIDDGLLMVRTREDGERIIEALTKKCNLKFASKVWELTVTYLDRTVFKREIFQKTGILDVKGIL